ncbi:YndJ family protein [Planococcus lenghuensis]|uniref:YndJ-like protein n=1 Tax=Planococcus lenghuensis TaxID=2213202 RepID=A0A1Q2L2V0_9BACL|nr:YndJ family protein [Planococcus lenghuensis]AQQ54785.1 hypothetical protein B0X71_17870 [Planococcus lenghuensis]
MLANLRKAVVNPPVSFGLLLFFVSLLVCGQADHSFYLLAAQLIFVPALLQLVVELRRLEKMILAAGMAAAAFISFGLPYPAALVCALVYLIVTFWIAWKGAERFLKRGFSNTAELMIDLGLVYIAVGGLWFFAFVGEFDTGFSAMTMWLTAIHFHYSAFMLCVSVGLLGRIRATNLYKLCALFIATGPMTVALGIIFSHTLELTSVSLYVLAIYALTFYTFRLRFPFIQALMIRIPFVTLCLTILWSFLYAYGNFSGTATVTIPTMLAVHGLLNCLLFGSFTVIGWALHVPITTQEPFHFPVSKIRGKLNAPGTPHRGLVDRMEDYVDNRELPASIIDFYEHTERFQLFASVQWAAWFKPFAFFYQFISRRVGQLNLPFSADRIEMTGEILLVDEEADGRARPRVWKRTIRGKPVFTAIYSQHEAGGETFMNIALPLPFSSMHGILQLSVEHGQLRLTSKGGGDAGTYLALGGYVFKLPLHESFIMKGSLGNLLAVHDMTLFGLHFLHIDYVIKEKTNGNQPQR